MLSSSPRTGLEASPNTPLERVLRQYRSPWDGVPTWKHLCDPVLKGLREANSILEPLNSAGRISDYPPNENMSKASHTSITLAWSLSHKAILFSVKDEKFSTTSRMDYVLGSSKFS